MNTNTPALHHYLAKLRASRDARKRQMFEEATTTTSRRRT